MVMSEDTSEDFDMSDIVDDSEDDPQWSDLSTENKKELMNNIFEDESWYNSEPAHTGGSSLPEFSEIAQRLGAPTVDIKKYYASWLTHTQGLDAKSIMLSGSTMDTPQQPTGHSAPPSIQLPPMQSESSQPTTAGSIKNALVGNMLNDTFAQQKDEDPMKSMMMFMMLNTIIESDNRARTEESRTRQQQFDVAQNNVLRQETSARQDQMLQMQLNMMNNWFKQSKKQDQGLFGSGRIGEMMEEKFVDTMFDTKESSVERVFTKLLDPNVLGAAVTGARAAFTATQQPQVPMGYDSPTYNPYAQPIPEGTETEQPVEVVEPEVVPEVVTEVPPDEYKEALLKNLMTIMGDQLEDPQTRETVVSQIDIAVEKTIALNPELTPDNKLEKMAEELILIRSLRDVGAGLREAKAYIDAGLDRERVLSEIKEALVKQPAFHSIFSNYTYEGMMALIEPYKETGGVVHDYNYLLSPEIASLCRDILASVKE